MTAAPLYGDHSTLERDAWITRGDIAVIAGVQPNTVRMWSQTQADWPPERRYKNLRVMRYGDAIDWLCKTGRLDCPRPGELTREEIADTLGISIHTLEKYRRQGVFPQPTRRRAVDRVPLWEQSVVDEFAATRQATA